MLYCLRVMCVLLVVLLVLFVSLTIIAFLAWDVNSKVILPEIVEKCSAFSLSDENVGTYLEVLTGIVALLFPISLQIINDAKGKYFSSQEVTSVVFKQREYKGLYAVLFVLITFTIVSFWEPIPKWVLFLMLCAITATLIFLYFFFKNLEEIISDFSQLVRKEEKSNIKKMLKDGQN
ncbi:hypothetical protein [Algoriphagus aquimarinus]|uniref:Uncharacterized protein n=1 Tax=Algoriphagus aquimarinus TaxID=237018 RepID=A0A1I1CAU4_9BACT|nr:hypothetical protein [Algoriphagus aquimarinus]SFB59779.1 hypothetical protein SAMN04489723_12712 [Algoriphagus aquimarinus]